MSGYAGWKRERRLERAKWAYLKNDPMYSAIRLATRGGWWTVSRPRRRIEQAQAQMVLPLFG